MGTETEVKDVIDDIFVGADLYYPGSKKLRREEPASKQVVEDAWDAHPIVKVYNGEKTEFFLAGSLAKALGKATVTIRLWEKRGHIPQAPYRLPGYTDAKGVKHPGKRAYSRRLIEIAVEEFKARGLMDVDRVEWKKHEDLTIALVERWQQEKDS